MSITDTTGRGESALFAEGIYIENLHLTVPWNVHEDELSRYGDPTIAKRRRHGFGARWDSVTLFRGIMSLLIYDVNGKWTSVHIIIASKDGGRLKDYLDSASGGAARKVGLSKKSAKGYGWRINGCSALLVIIDKNDTAHLYLQKNRDEFP